MGGVLVAPKASAEAGLPVCYGRIGDAETLRAERMWLTRRRQKVKWVPRCLHPCCQQSLRRRVLLPILG